MVPLRAAVLKKASPVDSERLFYVKLSNLGQLVAQVAQFVAQIREGFAQSNSAGSTRYLLRGLDLTGLKWSGRMDLNHRPPGPEPGALARLRYAPTEHARPHSGLSGITTLA